MSISIIKNNIKGQQIKKVIKKIHNFKILNFILIFFLSLCILRILNILYNSLKFFYIEI